MSSFSWNRCVRGFPATFAFVAMDHLRIRPRFSRWKNRRVITRYDDMGDCSAPTNDNVSLRTASWPDTVEGVELIIWENGRVV